MKLDKSIEDLNLVLMKHITERLYVNVCQGLFEKDKIIYSFLICSSIEKNGGKIEDTEYNMLFSGPGIIDRTN